MELRRIHKKLAEAHYFLRLLRDQEPRIGGDKNAFDFLLSAFLSAARSVDYRLRHEHKAYEPWRKTWDPRLTPAENGLIKFMTVDRDEEFYENGSGRSGGQEGIEFDIGAHHRPGGPVPIGGRHITEYTRSYSFTIDGVDRKVTEACGAYLALLERMVAQFQADLP